MAITNQMRTEVTQNYVALFGRAPDAEGLAYWVQQMDAGTSIETIAQDMYNTEPARDYYPLFLTNAEIVTSFYENVLGRSPDAEGLAYWTGRLNASSEGAVIREMINAVVGWSGTDADGKMSQDLFMNKVKVAEYYAVKLSGGVDYAGVVLEDVTATSDTSTDAAIASIIAASGYAPHQNFTLTTGVDVIIGTPNDDTITGFINYDVEDGTTLNSGDVIDGGLGNDTLKVVIEDDSDNDLHLNMKNVERMEVRDFDGQYVYGENVTGLHTVSTVGSSDTTYFYDFKYVIPNLEFHNTDEGIYQRTDFVVAQVDMLNVLVDNSDAWLNIYSDGSSNTSNYKNATVTSTGDGWDAGQNGLWMGETRGLGTLKVVGTTDIDIYLEFWDDGAGGASVHTVDASGLAAGLEMDTYFEGDGTVIGGSGDDQIVSYIDYDDVALSVTTGDGDDYVYVSTWRDDNTVTISTGDGDDEIEVWGTGIDSTFTISAGDGADHVDVDSAGAANEVHVDAGAGDDHVVVGNLVDKTNTYNGGDGTDTLSVSAQSVNYVDSLTDADQAIVAGNLANFEVLQVSTALNSDLDMSVWQNIPSVILDATSNTTISEISSGFALTLKGGANNVTLVLAANGASDSVGVTLSSAGALAAGTVTAADFETVNITTKDTNTTTHQDSLTLVATSATKVTVSGNAGLNLTNTGNTKITNFDASGVTKGDVVFESENATTTAAVSITGGDGNDTLTGNAAKDTINGGAGNDTIDGMDGDDVLNGGEGDNEIYGGAGKDTITAGAGDDEIYGDAGNDTIAAGNGDNSIMGGAGLDTMTGGTGVDTYWYGAASESQGTTVDVITNFTGGEDGDVLDFSVLAIAGEYKGEANGYGAVLTSLEVGTAWAVLDSSTSILYVDVDASGTLDNMDLAIQLTGVSGLTDADNFVW